MMLLIVATVVTWVASLVTRNYSWVDRAWSILPVAYVWLFAVADGVASARVILVAVLVTLWGIRLTANLARKGGYRRGGEDYRWTRVRSTMPAWLFQVVNLLFIAVFQNVLLWFLALPVLWVTGPPPAPFSGWYWLLAVAFLTALGGETIAVQQQWNFQQRKKAEIAAGGAPAARFCQTGLFARSRHPAWFFEVIQWWIVFLFAVVANGRGIWAPQGLIPIILGAVLLSALFAGSVRITEKISRERYPEYAEYQARVSPFIPWFARRPSRDRVLR
jgi:steroid 5-alpha reductase family enzyme